MTLQTIDPASAKRLIDDGAILVDVREPDEYEQGALAGSVHLPRGNLESSIEGRIPDKSAHGRSRSPPVASSCWAWCSAPGSLRASMASVRSSAPD